MGYTMTTQYAVLPARSGRSYTGKLFTVAAPDTEVTGNTITVEERTNAKGMFRASIDRTTALPAGDYILVLLQGALGAAVGYFTFSGTDGETATETPVTAVLDSATRVKLDATQPDYAPATPAQVNAQVLDVLSVDTFAELTAPPAATSSLKDKITWLFMYARNKITQTAIARTLYRDDTTTVAGTSTTSDDGTTFTKGEDA